MRKNTGYINSFDVIDINKGEVSFNDIYKEDIVKKINNTYETYYNKSMDGVPNSVNNVATIQNFLVNLTNNYNSLDVSSNILNTDELIRLKKIYALGIMPIPDISVTTVSIPTETINDILDDISRFELIKDSLTDPDKRKFYFQVYSTSNEYTIGEANFDSLIITNSQNLEQMIEDITKTAEDLKNDDLIIYDSLVNFPVVGVIGEVYLANDTDIKYEWNDSEYVISTNTSYFAGANKLNAKLDRELNSKLETIKADAIEFAVHFANLIKYLYYGIKNPDLGGGGITLDLYNLMMSYFNDKYPQFDLTPFERFNEVPVNNYFFGKSFRKILLKMYGGTFDVYTMQTSGDILMDNIKYYYTDSLNTLYYGSNAYKSNLSNVIPVAFKTVIDGNNELQNTVYNQLNVLLRLANSYTITGFDNLPSGNFYYHPYQSSLKYSTGTTIYTTQIGNYPNLTNDFYGVNHPSTAYIGASYYTIGNPTTTKNEVFFNTQLYPLIEGIWNNSVTDNTNRRVGGSLNLKHKCNALYSIINSTLVGNDLTRINEFDSSNLITTRLLASKIIGRMNYYPSSIGVTGEALTFLNNVLTALSIENFPTIGSGYISLKVPYSYSVIQSNLTYDSEVEYELEFYGITP